MMEVAVKFEEPEPAARVERWFLSVRGPTKVQFFMISRGAGQIPIAKGFLLRFKNKAEADFFMPIVKYGFPTCQIAYGKDDEEQKWPCDQC